MLVDKELLLQKMQAKLNELERDFVKAEANATAVKDDAKRLEHLKRSWAISQLQNEKRKVGFNHYSYNGARLEVNIPRPPAYLFKSKIKEGPGINTIRNSIKEVKLDISIVKMTYGRGVSTTTKLNRNLDYYL